MEKMLLTEALDERDFLKKKIKDKIAKFNPIDFKINSAEKCSLSVLSKDEFEKSTKAEWESIKDLIDRFNKINVSIIRANSEIILQGDYVDGLSIAQAISYRELLQNPADNFQNIILNKFATARGNIITSVDIQNGKVRQKYDKLTETIMARTKTEVDGDNESDIKMLEMMKQKDTAEIIDPLNLDKVISDLEEKKSNIISKINSAIKIANATHYIEI